MRNHDVMFSKESGMKLTIDTDNKSIVLDDGQAKRTFDLYSKDAFEVISISG